MPHISIKGLEKKFGTVSVIAGLDLELNDHEFTVFVGPSGCGKSTTLRIIAGLETASQGEIWIGDREVSALDPKDRDIAMVFQDYALYPHMNVAKNMSFALRLARMSTSEIEARVKRVAEILSITHLLDRKPAALSGGQRQRVAMGRALVRDASVFLFDEPLSNLDAKLRTQMRAELALMHQRIEKNMIYVTHDQVEAMTLADRIVVMNGGKVQQQGSPEELYKHPANMFVAGFIGAPTMNFLPATLVEEAGALHARGEGFDLVLPEKSRAALAHHSEREGIIGVRPSAIKVSPTGHAESVLRLDVSLTEYIGSQSILLAKCGSSDVMVEISSENRMAPSQNQPFEVETDSIHFFNKHTQLAVF